MNVDAFAGDRVVRFSHARLTLRRPIYWVSSYWVDGALIDVGPRWCRDVFNRRLGNRRVDVIWATHHHEDHVGNVGPLQRERGVGAYASSYASAKAREPRRLEWYRRHAWGVPDVGDLQALTRHVSTPSHHFEVLSLPGHTGGDVVFFEADEGWAFTGDAFLSPRQVATMPGEDLAAHLHGVERLAALRPRTLFTGIRVFENAGQVLHERLVFLRQVLHDLQVLRKQGFTKVQARRKLLGREGFSFYFSGGKLAKQNLVEQAWSGVDLRIP